jgi:hypothetical protein
MTRLPFLRTRGKARGEESTMLKRHCQIDAAGGRQSKREPTLLSYRRLRASYAEVPVGPRGLVEDRRFSAVHHTTAVAAEACKWMT